MTKRTQKAQGTLAREMNEERKRVRQHMMMHPRVKAIMRDWSKRFGVPVCRLNDELVFFVIDDGLQPKFETRLQVRFSNPLES